MEHQFIPPTTENFFQTYCKYSLYMSQYMSLLSSISNPDVRQSNTIKITVDIDLPGFKGNSNKGSSDEAC